MTTLVADSSNDTPSLLTLASLEAALREVEPGAMLVPVWALQNIMAFDEGGGKRALHVPPRGFHLISRDRLTKIVRNHGLDLPGELPAADSLVLLVRPEHEWLKARPAAEALRQYWKLLFHARVASQIRRKLSPPAAGREAIEDRIERIGRSAFNEARFVLQRERHLPPTAGEADAYAGFAAVYLEMHSFRPELLRVYFPSIEHGTVVLEALSIDVEPQELLRQTRLAGAADAQPRDGQENATKGSSDDTLDDEKKARDEELNPKLLIAADRAASSGNIVRAAILRQLEAAGANEKYVCAAARHDLKRLVERLAASVHLDEHESAQWRAALAPLLPLCTGGWWNQEARLLYDLQKVCVNHEREIYSTNVVEWVMEFGRRPLRRPQPNQRIVLMDKALRSALRRLPRARITAGEREKLAELLHLAIHHNETHLRETLRPAIAESLKGELTPVHAVEIVAEKKVVEELLDGLTHRGFMTLSNVRDAISNNQIKFPDIRNPRTFAGDPLFRIDRRLNDRLDGVYHRGEVYLWFFQKVSSLFFATNIGRFITRTILLPLLGSYIIIVGLEHTLFAISRKIAHLLTSTYDPADLEHHGPAEMAKLAGKMPWHLPHLEPLLNFFPGKHLHTHDEMVVGNVTFAILAVLLLGLVNWAACRTVVWRVLVVLGRCLGFVFYTAPRWLLDRPVVQALLNSRPMRFAMRYVFKPLFFAAVTWLFVRHHMEPRTQWVVVGAVFIFMNFLLNNPVGRAIEQTFSHWIRSIWAHVTSDFFGNLFAAILHFFGRRLEDFDRMLYAVDEWLRFREGHSSSSLYMKATFGIFWFYIAYISRFALNLLVEPQINPIKHFPVVTVSHKIILPQIDLMKSLLPARAEMLAFPILFVIPGIFGFLAWELRSNWNLYSANRSRRLKPVMVGSHGESMARLLRPGFHSGTVPKLFARLRKAHRHADDPDPSGFKSEAAMHKHLESVEHVGEAVGRFVERELLALLNQHPAWKDAPLSLTGVNLCATRITIELSCPSLDALPMRIFFEQRAGWILAGIEQSGWSRNLSPFHARLFSAGLLGLYKIAGVDVVKEHVESLFSPTPVVFELTRDELIFWPGRQFDKPLIFNLSDETAPVDEKFRGQQLLLSRASIAWNDWVGIWDVPEKWSPSALPADGALSAPTRIPVICVLPG